MSLDPITSVSSIRIELEDGWKLFDETYQTFTPRQWSRKFGRTWTYADQPYHLAYFDRLMAKYLALGPDVPEPDRLHLRTMGNLSEWNRQELAKRSSSHTVEDSLRDMRASRDEVRRVLDTMQESDLDRRCWMPLLFGWTTARQVLQGIIIHNVAEYWKLWLRTGKRGRAPSPAAVHLRLSMMMSFMPLSLNRELAARQRFTMTWNFEGEGGGSWTFNVANGECSVSDTAAPAADLTITMRPENFHKMVAKMAPPPWLMLTGQMKVRGFGAMPTFAKLFPEPKPDQVLAPG